MLCCFRPKTRTSSFEQRHKAAAQLVIDHEAELCDVHKQDLQPSNKQVLQSQLASPAIPGLGSAYSDAMQTTTSGVETRNGTIPDEIIQSNGRTGVFSLDNLITQLRASHNSGYGLNSAINRRSSVASIASTQMPSLRLDTLQAGLHSSHGFLHGDLLGEAMQTTGSAGPEFSFSPGEDGRESWTASLFKAPQGDGIRLRHAPIPEVWGLGCMQA